MAGDRERCGEGTQGPGERLGRACSQGFSRGCVCLVSVECVAEINSLGRHTNVVDHRAKLQGSGKP